MKRFAYVYMNKNERIIYVCVVLYLKIYNCVSALIRRDPIGSLESTSQNEGKIIYKILEKKHKHAVFELFFLTPSLERARIFFANEGYINKLARFYLAIFISFSFSLTTYFSHSRVVVDVVSV